MVSLEKLNEILPSARLQELGITYQVDKKNQIRLPGKTVFLCLLHGLLHHKEITQRLLEETYVQLTGNTVDHSSFGKRLNVISADYFEALFREVHGKVAAEAPVSTLSTLKLRIVDATSVTLSAKILHFGLLVGTRSKEKPRRHIKSVIELTDELPNFLHLCTDKTENADSIALGVTMRQHSNPGDLWIFDKGCHGRQRLLDIHEKEAFFLTPHTMQGLRIERVLWNAESQAENAEFPTIFHEKSATLPEKGPAGFVLVRVEQGFFENSQTKQNKRWDALPLLIVHGLRFDTRSKSWKPLILMTNLAVSSDEKQAGPFTFEELAEVYQRRWDIEVFFKFVKQHLSYSHLLSRSENGIRVMIYMSLIAATLLIWYKAQTGIDRGWRSVKSWLAFDSQKWLVQALRDTFTAEDYAENFPAQQHYKRYAPATTLQRK